MMDDSSQGYSLAELGVEEMRWWSRLRGDKNSESKPTSVPFSSRVISLTIFRKGIRGALCRNSFEVRRVNSAGISKTNTIFYRQLTFRLVTETFSCLLQRNIFIFWSLFSWNSEWFSCTLNFSMLAMLINEIRYVHFELYH